MLFRRAKGCQRMRFPNEMEDGELLISLLYRKPPPFSQVCTCSSGQFHCSVGEVLAQMVMREDRNPISMMWALALPGGNYCFCLKGLYLEDLTQAECGRKGM